MATYEYRCRDCGDVFEVRRAMSAAAVDVRCPAGHSDATRVWSAVAFAGGAAPARAGAPAGGGCCGGGCCGGGG
jgi:putative FmdB family regulatory protein